jgi:t-SNARE complex subunit (syntaxin)
MGHTGKKGWKNERGEIEFLEEVPMARSKKVQRCLGGGLAAGALACTLNQVRRTVDIRKGDAATDVWSAYGNALSQAKAARLQFIDGKQEFRAIEKVLTKRLKEFQKEAKKGLIAISPSHTRAEIVEMQKTLKEALGKGKRMCADAAFPSQVTSLLEAPPVMEGRKRRR